MNVGDCYQTGPVLPGKPWDEQPPVVTVLEVLDGGLVLAATPDGKAARYQAADLAQHYRGNLTPEDLAQLLLRVRLREDLRKMVRRMKAKAGASQARPDTTTS
jgi:predicted ATPase